MGEDLLQWMIAEMFRGLVEGYLAERGVVALTGADQFIYWEQYAPTKTRAPDVYVLPGVAPGTRVTSWKIWETGIAPSFALEVVSSNDVEKDYRDAPPRYAEMGVTELVLFDPDFELDPSRVRFQVYRRLARRGFTRVERTTGDRIRSRVLGCWLRSVGAGAATRLRLATGVEGETLWPTETERADAERAAKDAERAAKEAAEARADRAEAELARLRAELAKRS